MRPAAVPLALAFALALALVMPAVLADHAYSHRYLVYGRVVDADGNAVKGLTVLMQTRHFFPNPAGCESREGSKTDAFGRTDTRFVTNEHGEFVYCYHQHEMSKVEPGEATISIPSEGSFTNVTFDPYMRVTFVPIVLSAPHPNATRALDTSYTVLGRIWEPHETPVTLEGQTVFGLTLVDSRVNVTLTLPDGTVLRNETRSNDYGDFAVRFPLASRATGGTVRIEAFSNATVNETRPVDPKLGMTVFQAKLPEVGASSARSIAKFVAIGVVGALVLVAIGFAARSALRRRSSSSRASTRAARRRQQK